MEGLSKLIKQAEQEAIPVEQKSEGQEAVIKLATTLIQERLKQLGVDERRFDVNNIRYHSTLDSQKLIKENSVGHHKVAENIVNLRASNEANLPAVVHELLHAHSTSVSKMNLAENSISEEPGKQYQKSGFHSVWFKGFNENGEAIGRDIFRAINEAVTEKLARELAAQGNSEYKKLAPMFQGRKETILEAHERHHTNISLPHAQELDDQRKLKLMQNLEQSADVLNRCIEVLQSQLTEDEREFWMNEARNWAKEVQFWRDSLSNNVYSKDAINDFEENRKYIEASFAFDVTKIPADSYTKELEVINIFLTRHAENLMKQYPNLEPADALELAWQETQKAYFEGNVFFLRKFDRYFGEGTLSELQLFMKKTPEEKTNFIARISTIHQSKSS